MSSFKVSNVLTMLQNFSESDKKKKAQSCNDLKNEIKNVLNDTKIILYNQTREDAIKYILWQGILNRYGIFGTNRTQHRLFNNGEIDYYSQEYKHGDVVSVDFGTSNIGSEFSFTHTALVLHAFTDFLIVIPITTAKGRRLENKPIDEQESTLVIQKEDFPFIESDSYVLVYQIKSVSKNRITKKIGNVSNSKFLCDVDNEVFKILLNPIMTEYSNEILNLNEKICEYQTELEKKNAEITKLKTIINYSSDNKNS